jgi:hypothetical protein
MTVKRTVTRITKAQRAAARKGVSLQDLIIRPRTLARYELGIACFFNHKRVENFDQLCNSFMLDEQFADWIKTAYEEGETRGLVGDALSGIQHFVPSLKRNLNMSWRLYNAWQKSELPAQAPPITLLLAMAVAGLPVEMNYTGFAVVLMLGFRTFARSG